MTTDTYVPAPIWRRLAALVYDSFILLALSFFYGGIITAFAAARAPTTQDYQPMFTGVLFPLGWALTLIGFYCFFWQRSGQTIGMKTWHLKLVREHDVTRTPGWLQCALRALVAAPAVLLCGVGYVYGALHPRRQTLQDKLSGTRVLLVAKDAQQVGNLPH